jgi:energy-coupling factor transporter ATP-binding protein EcfA2
MAEINFGKTVSLAQAATVIAATPMNRYLLEGEPGIGKSSLIKTLAAMFPTHSTAYIDVPNMDLGDIAMPVIDRETKTTSYYPNARFQLHLGKPVITMLDEFTKGAEPIKNMLHPMLEVSNPRLGDIPVHEQSITFLTGNLSSDGVGDSLKAHSRNRIIPLHVRKPDADEWIVWALNNNVAAEVIAWVRQYPHALSSYMDGNNDGNPYIYNPRKPQKAFVSPRSLERVSNLVKVRAKLDTDTLIAAMTGAIGESASRDMQAYVEFADQLPTWEAVMQNPRSASVPDTAGACAIIVFGAIAKVTKDTMSPFMEYLSRFEAEWQACFAINIAKTPSKQAIAFSNKKFADWVQLNEDLL